MIKKFKHIFCFLLLVTIHTVSAQSTDRIADIEQKLKELSKTNAGLNEKIEYSLNGSSVQDLITGLATMHNLNVTVDPAINVKLYNNFSNVTIAEVFAYLCKQYNLDISFVGSIMTFINVPPPPIEVKKVVPRTLKISFNSTDNTISFDLQNDSLLSVCKEITKLTGKNIVLAPEVTYKPITSFIQALPINEALDKMAFANDLKSVSPDKNNSFIIDKAEKDPKTNKKNNSVSGNYNNEGENEEDKNLSIKMDSVDKVTLKAVNTPISEILATVTSKMNKNYYLFTELKGNISLSVKNVNYDAFLNHLFNGTDYTFKKDSSTYLIGTRKLEGLRATKMYQFKYRTTDKVLDIIPAELKKDLELYVYPEQNAIIMSGSQPRIQELHALLLEVDKIVPVISIDVIIFDVNDTKTISTGLSAGLGKAPVKSEGSVYPNIDVTLSSNALNDIISGVNGMGLVNLGSVTPNFYANLKLLESKGSLKVKSTPKIATLNGNEANLSIGKTEYYLETTTTVTGSVNTNVQNQVKYNPINADFALKITPVLSADEYVTLDVDVSQESFTERISETAPPGKKKQKFTSKIRVKNGETIILGGLEEYKDNESSSGIPILSRIPVIKWLFSSRTKSKNKSKLVVVIKPTVIY